MIRLIEFRGVRYTTREIADLTGISPHTLRTRIENGWTVERIVTTPTPKQRRRGIVSTVEGLDLPACLNAMLQNSNTARPGVPSDFEASEGTGAGSSLQETPEITFSKKAEIA